MLEHEDRPSALFVVKPFRAQEGAVGEVIAFGLPVLRARRKPTTGFCEVTVLPNRPGDDRDPGTSAKTTKGRATRKRGGVSRPVGLCRK